jgi:hypothetical protein
MKDEGLVPFLVKRKIPEDRTYHIAHTTKGRIWSVLVLCTVMVVALVFSGGTSV